MSYVCTYPTLLFMQLMITIILLCSSIPGANTDSNFNILAHCPSWGYTPELHSLTNHYFECVYHYINLSSSVTLSLDPNTFRTTWAHLMTPYLTLNRHSQYKCSIFYINLTRAYDNYYSCSPSTDLRNFQIPVVPGIMFTIAHVIHHIRYKCNCFVSCLVW